jgi:hypothetical protein
MTRGVVAGCKSYPVCSLIENGREASLPTDLQRIFDGPVDVIATSSTDPALVHAAALSSPLTPL